MSHRKIADPIHGSIEISKKEAIIIDSAPFQRLRQIKQLGNVHLVFPQATHTRFAHSVGVMHVCGLYFDALFAKSYENYPHMSEKLGTLRQILRLAGLLHDIGHGPMSHHFENCLKTISGSDGHLKKCKVNYLNDHDLSVIKDFTIADKAKFETELLQHEHYSYGVIKYLLNYLSIQDVRAQDVCALLDKRIAPSAAMQDLLSEISQFCFERARRESLLDCLRSVLSGEVDADRLDYLQRDSYNCGVKIGGVDLGHFLSSITLAVDNTKRDSSGNSIPECYIQVKQNAVTSYEQILLSRKQMFNQVYNHRLNSSFDDMLEKAIDYLLIKGILVPPRTYQEFLTMTDTTVESAIEQIAIHPTGNREIDLCAQMFVTRTPLVKTHEAIVPLHRVSVEKMRLEQEHSASSARVIIAKTTLKQITKQARDNEKYNSDVFRVEPEYPDAEPININVVSEVLNSTAYRTLTARLVVFKTYEESAHDRDLPRRLRLACLPTQ